jgi:hypothetical protein
MGVSTFQYGLNGYSACTACWLCIDACPVNVDITEVLALGKCGRCNLGEKLVCVDGPVFTMKEVGRLLESFL